MKALVSCRGGQAPPRRKSLRLEDLVGAAQLAILALKLFDTRALNAREPEPQAVIGLSPAHRPAHGPRRHAELGGD